MKKNKLNEIILVSYGSIGEFLMFLNIADNYHRLNSDFRMVIYCSRNTEFLNDLASGYNFVFVRHLRVKSIFLHKVKYGFVGNSIIIKPFTFNKLSFKSDFIIKIISMLTTATTLSFSAVSKYSIFKAGFNVNYDKDKLFIENMFELISAYGFSCDLYELGYRFKEEFVLDLGINDHETYVVVHIKAANDSRSFPMKRWAEIAKNLDTFGVKLYFTGSNMDKKDIDAVICGLKNSFNFAGQLNFNQLATLIKGARCYIGVDTGITHLAGLLGVAGVIVGNNSNPSWLPSYNKNFKVLVNNKNCSCAGNKTGDCYYEINSKKYFRCMMDISNDDIFSFVSNKIRLNISD